MVVIVIISVSSCTSAEQKCYNNFNSFVNAVEQDAPNYTEQDWEACTEAYETYVQDLDAFSQLYTPDQNREIGRMKARYHKLALKYHLNRASNFVNNMSYQMEGYIDEMGDTDEENSVKPSAERLEQDIIDAVERMMNHFEE